MAERELLEILRRTTSANAEDQATALNYIDQASAHHFLDFVQHLTAILAGTNNEGFVRQAAGLQLKNTLASNDDERRAIFQQRWLQLPEQIRQTIKQCVLQTLGTEARPSAAAQCISAIAAVEVPQGQWLDVINVLSNNITSAESRETLKEASLEAIGYICSALPTAFMEAFANNVLTAIVHGMRVSETADVRYAATTALFNSLEFTQTNFNNEQERNVIMENVCQTTQAAENKTKVVALQCLVKIMSQYYQHMEAYMLKALFPITVAAMKSNIDDIELQGIEFWSNVCEEESGLAIEAHEAAEEGRPPNQVSRHYAQGALQYLVPILTQILTKQEEDPDDDEWIPAKAAGVCIMLLAQCCRDAIIEHTLPFITNNFHNENWHYREAAVMTLGSILDGPDPGTLLRLVEQAMMPLIERVKDQNVAVRDTAIWTVGRVCDLCVDLVSKPEVIQHLLPALFTTLNQQPTVASNACWTISSLVKATYRAASDRCNDTDGEPDSFILSTVFEPMIKELVTTSDRQDATIGLRNAAYEALMDLIKNSPKDCYTAVKKTTIIVLEKMSQFLNYEESLVNASERSQLRDLISQLCATLQSVLRKMHETDVPSISDQIFNILLQIMRRYQQRDGGAVVEEAMMAMSALITVMKTDFERYMDTFKPILFAALANFADSELCINALGVISDLCTAFEANTRLYSDDIVGTLVKLLSDASPARRIKCTIIEVLGDIINALGAEYVRYIEPTMEYVKHAVEACNRVLPTEDFDELDYINSLREACICVFTALTQSFNNTEEQKAVMRAYMPSAYTLIAAVASAQPPVSDSLLAAALSLVGDLVVTFTTQTLGLIDSEPVTNMMTRLRRSRQNKSKTAVAWVSREMQRVRRMAGASA